MGHVSVQRVVVQHAARLQGYPESVLAANATRPEALTLGCGFTSSYLGSSASFTHPPLPPHIAPLMAMAQLKGHISNPSMIWFTGWLRRRELRGDMVTGAV